MGAGSLNDFSEVVLEKFINTETLLPYIDSTVFGNIYGTTQAAICLPNHPNYSSDFNLSVNLGGALGDSTWMDGEDVEPAYVGVHSQNDIFAPYYEGPVIVPTTNQFVIYATGTRKCIEIANQKGSNDVLNGLDASNDPIRSLIEFQNQTMLLFRSLIHRNKLFRAQITFMVLILHYSQEVHLRHKVLHGNGGITIRSNWWSQLSTQPEVLTLVLTLSI